MFKQSALFLTAALILSACADSQPRIIQTSAGASEVRLVAGAATQVEMPDAERVKSVIIGNPGLVTADQNEDVVSLNVKEGTGETNMIIRAVDEDGHVHVYQYRVVVQGK